ncbi:MAG: aminotransferase [Rhodobiaceae bacterium]|nr:aminotransferase [Rhodobiaceae bacterium]
MKSANPVYAGLGTTIFEVMSRLAIAEGAINLGQGFPDTDGPATVREAAARYAVEGPNQYPPMLGVPALRQAVAAHDKRFYGLDVDWQTETMVTSGATEALADAIFALVEPGDEVVLFAPLYDCYLPLVRRAGGVPRIVPVNPPDWAVTDEALDAAFSANTKMVLINNPMNPAGKVFTVDELERIAARVRASDAYVVADEVYEHIVFDDHRMIPFITLPGMRERTVKIASAGKSFSLTGWKVGMITAAPDLLQPIAKAHQFMTFTTPPHLQLAVAEGLALGDDYYASLAGDLRAKRDRLADGLADLGFAVLDCQGTYFVTCDCAGLGLGDDDAEICRTLTVEAGVAAVPASAFFPDPETAPKSFIRFCFSKKDEVLDGALERLGAYLKR